MAKSGYKCVRFGDGYYTFEVDGFRTFIDDIAPQFLKPKRDRFVWRGSRNPSWGLTSSLTRVLNEHQAKRLSWKEEIGGLTTRHAIQSIELLRGLDILKERHDALYRTLTDISTRRIYCFRTVLKSLGLENEQLICELFATGQHYGLLTPFLDWTDLPAIALFFAFAGEDDANQPAGVGNRVVYALNHSWVTEVCPPGAIGDDDDILFMSAMAHDNPRIIAQQGLFTFIPAHVSIDEWVVRKYRRAADVTRPALIRFLIHNEERAECLNHLASLNIQERTLFPDLHGAATRANDLLRKLVKR